MKKITMIGSQFILILLFISCISSRGVHLINLEAKELPSETELVLTTTNPIQYNHMKLDNPPSIIIDFPEKKVFSIEKDEMINKGAIKKIKYEYDTRGDNIQPYLSLVIVELVQDLPYKISNSGSSIIIRIKNPEQPLDKTFKEKIKIEAPLQIKNRNPALEPGYLIGPGDILKIEVWKQPDVTREITVNYRGEIRLPPIKKLSVIGLSAPQLEDRLTEALSKYIIEPIVFVSILEYNSQRIIALGETATGMYTLKRRTTLMEFLSEIGGTTENADIFHIKLIKKDGQTFTYDLNELIGDPQKSDEVVVSGGDTVYVPPLEFNKVYVLGEVTSPKIITIGRKLTLIDAITEAGGYTRDAAIKSVMVIRGELGSQKGIRINLSRILKKGDVGQNIELKAGDIVFVPKSFIVDVERFLRALALPATWYFWIAR